MSSLNEKEIGLVSGAAYSTDPAVINCNNGIIGGMIAWNYWWYDRLELLVV